jgi:hypothetical protein
VEEELQEEDDDNDFYFNCVYVYIAPRTTTEEWDRRG